MMHEAWAHSAFMWAMHLVLSDTPFFPVQIAAGAYLGWRPHSALLRLGMPSGRALLRPTLLHTLAVPDYLKNQARVEELGPGRQ